MRFWNVKPIPNGPVVTIEANTQPEALDAFAQFYLDRETYKAAEVDGMIPDTLTCEQTNSGPATDHIAFLEAFNAAAQEAAAQAQRVANDIAYRESNRRMADRDAATAAALAQVNAAPILAGTPEGRIAQVAAPVPGARDATASEVAAAARKVLDASGMVIPGMPPREPNYGGAAELPKSDSTVSGSAGSDSGDQGTNEA